MQSLEERYSRRLQRLREHHQACARRFNEATVRMTHLEQEKNLLLTQMMERKRKQEKELDLGTSDESGDNDGSDYVSSPNSTDGEDCSPVQLHNDAEMQEQEELKDDTDDVPDQKEEGSPKITVQRCLRGEKRKWNKKHYCIYCKQPQSKIARHLLRRHKNEADVARVASIAKNSKKRRLLLDQLRCKGDYNHNLTVLQIGQGEIVTVRQPSEEVNPLEYLPCNYCYGFFRKSELWKHDVSCKNRNGLPQEKFTTRNRVQAAASCLIPKRGNTTERCSKIIDRMLHDEVSLEVKSDPLICKYGDRLLEKHGSDPSKDGYVSQKMRELGRFVMAAKALNTKVEKLEDILVPPHFKLAVDAAKKAYGYTNSKYRYDRPYLAVKLGHCLKTVGDIMIGQYVKAEDEAAAHRVRSFLGLVRAEWNHYVSHRARTNLEENKWNKKEMIPLTEDVIKLQKYLKSMEENAREKLEEGPDPKAYSMLSETVLSQIILFNRRRQGKAAKMELETYKSKNTEALNEDVMQCLSKFEKDLSNDFTRIVIRGKRGRKIPVLLTGDMTRSLDFLIEHRMQENDILDTNKYVFARPKSDSHIRGSDCLRKFASLCDAKYPETLTSTQLRKHIATLCQIMNLKDHELDQVAKFMGHDIRVHREYYHLTENTVQLAKMSKLLMAIECGTNVYKGKSLDEIDLELEVALSQKHNQGHASEHAMRAASPGQEQDELPRSRKRRPDLDESCDGDLDSDEFPATHTKAKVRRSSKPDRVEFPRSRKRRPDLDESCDGDLDSDGSAVKKRQPWSDTEKKAVWRQLGNYITLMRVPGKNKCVECIDAEPALKSRQWLDVKNYTHNSIESRKKKMSRC